MTIVGSSFFIRRVPAILSTSACDPLTTPTDSPITYDPVPMTNINYACALLICRLQCCEVFPDLCQAGQNPEAGNVWQETVKLTCYITHGEEKTRHAGPVRLFALSCFYLSVERPGVNVTFCRQTSKSASVKSPDGRLRL